jgi:hypothetical protein
MTIWAQRTFGFGLWGHVQDDFEKLFLSVPDQTEMLLIAVDQDGLTKTRLIAKLPAKTFLAALPGFETIETSELPEMASLLVGQQDVFERYFRFGSPE